MKYVYSKTFLKLILIFTLSFTFFLLPYLVSCEQYLPYIKFDVPLRTEPNDMGIFVRNSSMNVNFNLTFDYPFPLGENETVITAEIYKLGEEQPIQTKTIDLKPYLKKYKVISSDDKYIFKPIYFNISAEVKGYNVSYKPVTFTYTVTQKVREPYPNEDDKSWKVWGRYISDMANGNEIKDHYCSGPWDFTPGMGTGTGYTCNITVGSKNGGSGCFPAGTKIRMVDGSTRNIEDIKIGDKILSFDGEGLVEGNVNNIFGPIKDYVYLLKTESKEIKVTSEHPFYVGNGRFLTVEELKVGDWVYVLKENKMVPEKIIYKELLFEPTYVYNLRVGETETFFAGDFAVHNKNGCFLAGTKILMADGSLKNIEDIKFGDIVLSFENDKFVPRPVNKIFQSVIDDYVLLKTERHEARVSGAHRFYIGNGEFRKLDDIQVGDMVYVVENGKLVQEKVISKEPIKEKVKVFNFNVVGSHTYIANGFAVHNAKPICDPDEFQCDSTCCKQEEICCPGYGCSRSGYCPSSFPASTKIITSYGSKPIETVRAGDEVLSLENGKIVKKKVVGVLGRHKADHYYILQTINRDVKVTGNHEFYTPKGYVKAKDLWPGDEVYVLSNSGKNLEVEKIVFKGLVLGEIEVYDLEVEDTHTYFANGFAVHNEEIKSITIQKGAYTIEGKTVKYQQSGPILYFEIGDNEKQVPNEPGTSLVIGDWYPGHSWKFETFVFSKIQLPNVVLNISVDDGARILMREYPTDNWVMAECLNNVSLNTTTYPCEVTLPISIIPDRWYQLKIYLYNDPGGRNENENPVGIRIEDPQSPNKNLLQFFGGSGAYINSEPPGIDGADLTDQATIYANQGLVEVREFKMFSTDVENPRCQGDVLCSLRMACGNS
ncbi:MAG: Hint domain-containing protein, partial [Candidatus Aenigmatarchaeota archaeon]